MILVLPSYTKSWSNKKEMFFFSLQPCQSLCSHIRCEAHYNEISCFTKYNINSVVTVFIIGSHTSLSTTLIQWECSWFLILCFHSVLFCCNFQLRNKRVCRPNVDFFYGIWHIIGLESKWKMKSKPCAWGLSVSSGGLNHHTMHSSCLVESKVFSLFARASLFSAGYGKVRPTKSEAKKTKCQ